MQSKVTESPNMLQHLVSLLLQACLEDAGTAEGATEPLAGTKLPRVALADDGSGVVGANSSRSLHGHAPCNAVQVAARVLTQSQPECRRGCLKTASFTSLQLSVQPC